MQAKHRKQMTAEEIQHTEALVHAIDALDLTDDHAVLRMTQKGVTKKDVAITAKWGEVIAVQSDGRVVMRLMTGLRKGVVIVIQLASRRLVTAWYNSPTDQHATLRLSEYTWKVNVIEYLRSI